MYLKLPESQLDWVELETSGPLIFCISFYLFDSTQCVSIMKVQFFSWHFCVKNPQSFVKWHEISLGFSYFT